VLLAAALWILLEACGTTPPPPEPPSGTIELNQTPLTLTSGEILADPPYSAEDADHYGTPLVSRNKVVAALAPRMARGGHLAWLDQAEPMYAKALLQPEAAIGIVRSTNHRIRMLLIWWRRAPSCRRKHPQRTADP
jgi:hypothetical protein